MTRKKRGDADRYRRNLKAELDGAALYRALAEAEKDPERSQVLLELARAEERHAAKWRERVRQEGLAEGEHSPGLRVRIVSSLARVFGTSSIAPLVQALERRDASSYAGQPEAEGLAQEEQGHARILSALGEVSSPAEIARAETWHRRAGSGSLRAAIFGVNDGLVSNLSLVMGVAGAAVESSFVLLAGLAGLLAGAFSMAAGEYISMRSQRELFEHQIELEREELELEPEEEAEEIALLYRAKGIPKEEAERLAQTLISSRDSALDTLAREELGLDPTELGSPWGASLSSFVAFALGAIVPVLPYLLLDGGVAIYVSAAISAIALFAVGAAVSLFTGKSAVFSGLRMLGIGAAAAIVSYLVGSVIGVSLS